MSYELTPQDYRNMADAIEAQKAGRPVQYATLKYNGTRLDVPGEWKSNGADGTGELDDFKTLFIYRPAPEPVTRPWSKPEDVPGPVCYLRNSTTGCGVHWFMVIQADEGTIDIQGREISWDALAKEGVWEHSTDRITWKPCVVVENAQ